MRYFLIILFLVCCSGFAFSQNGKKVQEAKLSDGEFVMKADAVKGLGNGDRAKGAARMYALQNQFSRMA